MQKLSKYAGMFRVIFSLLLCSCLGVLGDYLIIDILALRYCVTKIPPFSWLCWVNDSVTVTCFIRE